MARRSVSRKLEVFSVHAHVNGGPPDYRELFSRLARVSADRRQVVTEDRVIAVPRLTARKGSAFVVAVEGPLGLSPVVYNLDRQTERVETMEPGDIVVFRTHALIDIDRREAIIEYNQRGAKARDIAEVLQTAGRRLPGLATLELSLTPVVGEDFVRAIDSFERIKGAEVKMSRPNFDWSDWADDLTDAAGHSGAQSAWVEFSAGRGASLEKGRGIVGFLRRVVRTPGPSPVEHAAVTGRREDDAADTRVTSKGFTEHRRVTLPRGSGGEVDDDAALDAMTDFMRERREESDDSDS